MSYTDAGLISNIALGRHFCNTDGDNAGWWHATYGHRAAANNNSTTSLVPETSPYDISTTGNMRCLYWDAALPTVSNLTYNGGISGWSNNTNHTISFAGADTWGSNLERYRLQMRTATDSPSFSTWSSWAAVADVNVSWSSFSDTYNLVGASDATAYEFRLRVWDIAWNQSAWYNPWITLKIDTSSPIVWDIWAASPIPGNQLAINALTTRVDVNDGWGSPIVLVQWYYERNDINNSYTPYNSNSDLDSGNTSRLRINWNMQNVDNDGSTNNGQRSYGFRVTYIRDEAWNSIGTQNSNTNIGHPYQIYTVYADTTNITTKSLISEELSNAANYADWSQKNIIVQLADQYGNKIIPVASIGRTVDFHVQADNGLYLNQYEQLGASALFVGNNTNDIAIGNGVSEEAINLSSTSWNYTIPLFVYAPTNNQDAQVPGWADITGLQFDINRTTAIVSWDNPQLQNIDSFPSFSVSAQPVYTTNFIGDIETYGFIEWVEQNSSINIIEEVAVWWVSWEQVYLEFGGVNETDLELRWNGGDLSLDELVSELQDYSTIFKDNIWFTGNKILDTFLTAIGPVLNLEDSFLATIIEYVLDGKTIIYPSDIVNKSSYNNPSYAWWVTQVWVKIVWNTTSQKNQEIVANQFNDNVRILGRLTKSTYRRDIQQTAYRVIRYLIPKIWWGTTIITARLENASWNDTGLMAESVIQDSILYFGNMMGANITLDSAANIEWNKTLVVEWWNIYISWNIIDSDSDAILGLIALEKDGLWWNIYIAPSVTDIHAVMYMDKSLISYNGSELDGNNATTADLANQLYIFGSIFSENTIGGSRKVTAECPFYVNNSLCATQKQAQKYDLNYLRRYFRYDHDDNPGTDPIPANWWSPAAAQWKVWFEDSPVIIDYNPQVQQTPPPLFK